MVAWRTFEGFDKPEASLFHEMSDVDLTIETPREPFRYWSNHIVGLV
jgi:hypothetical protein